LRTKESRCLSAADQLFVDSRPRGAAGGIDLGIVNALVSAFVPKEATIERMILTLEREEGHGAISVKSIYYDDVRQYIKDKQCRIVHVKDHGDHEWIEFETWIRGNNYLVTLGKAWNDDGSYRRDAVITARLGDI
jgi:hypothetical protein